MPGSGSSGARLSAFDLDRPERPPKLKAPRGCAWVENFVSFDSASAEALWSGVEGAARAALDAVDAGAPFADPRHVDALRDLVTLHFVRSNRYREVHESAFASSRLSVRRGLIRKYPEQLRRQALQETGLYLPNDAALEGFAERLISRSPYVEAEATGELFRQSVENAFRQVQGLAADRRVEVVSPASGQFLIGDTPAASMRWKDNTVWHSMAFGDADTVVLPVDPHHALALGPENVMGTIPRARVDQVNTVQILTARRHVYFHPKSGLESFVRSRMRIRSIHQVG